MTTLMHILVGIAVAGWQPVAIGQVTSSVVDHPRSMDRARRAARERDVPQALQALQEAFDDGLQTSAVLTDPDLTGLHELPQFRGLVKEHAKEHVVDYIPQGEPGSRLRVTGRVLDPNEDPIASALVYVFQTDATGVYSSKGGNSTIGDSLNPRLFGYIRTDKDGRYTYSTIRPAEYRGGGPPAHIHYVVTATGFRDRITEIMFGDDPRLTGQIGNRDSDAVIVVDVEPGDDGLPLCTADIVMRPS